MFATQLPITDIRRTAWLLAGVVSIVLSQGKTGEGDDDLVRYFTQLRQRGLFTVAEHYAHSRIDDPQLAESRRTEFVVQLAQTLTAHAYYVSPDQQADLWDRARQIIQDELARQPPSLDLLNGQLALVAAARARGQRDEARLIPEDSARHEHWLAATDEALLLLKTQSDRLQERVKAKPRLSGEPSSYDQRQLLALLTLERAELLRDRAALANEGDATRASDLLEAQAAFKTGATLGVHTDVIARCELGQADILRLQKDFDRALQVCQTLQTNRPSLSPELVDAIDACRARIWLDQQQPLQAADHLLKVRQARHVISGELWLVQLESLLALRQAATERNDVQLAATLEQEATLALTRVAEQAGGSWARLCQLAWNRDQSRKTYGADLDRLIRLAQSEYQQGHRQEAVEAYTRAIAAVDQTSHVNLQHDIRYAKATVLLEDQQFEAAAGEFDQLVERFPEHPQAGAAHLLKTFALGRLYDSHRTQARREAYTGELQAHLTRFSGDPTADDARFMLAQLEEQRLQASKALPLYLQISSQHARYWEATVAAARCQETLVRRLQELHREWQTFQQQAVAELQQRLEPVFTSPSAWSPPQGEAAVRLARLQLMGQPADYQAAMQSLSKMTQRPQAELNPSANSPAEAKWATIIEEAFPLQIVALAGLGRSQQARQILESTATRSPHAALALVAGLDQLAQGPATQQFVDLTELLQMAIEQADSLRSQLSQKDRKRLDRAAIRAAFLTGDDKAGLARIDQLAIGAEKNAPLLRELAELSSGCSAPLCQERAASLWRQVESLETAGNPGWLAARVEVIAALHYSGKNEEAAKLLRLTRLLYPDPTEAAAQRRWAEVAHLVELDRPNAPQQRVE